MVFTMDRELPQHETKISRTLQKFLDPNFKVKNDVYLNLFLTHLIGKQDENNQQSTATISQDTFCQWIVQASTLWGQKKVVPSSTILSFTLNLASHMSKDEHVFVRLNGQNVYESLVGIIQSKQNPEATITLGFITLLCSFLSHKSGTQWILATNYWKEVVNLGLSAHTVYIRKKAYEFVIKLLENTIPLNRPFCVNLIQVVSKPLKKALDSIPNNNATNMEVQNRELFETLQPCLSFISEVVETLLKNYNKDVLTLLVELEVLQSIKKVLLLSHIEDFSFELIKILYAFWFFKQCEMLEGIKQVSHDATHMRNVRPFFSGIFASEMEKDHVRSIIKLCYHGHVLWSHVASRLPTCFRQDEPIEFPTQMILFQLMPLLALPSHFLGKQEKHVLITSDDLRREYVQKCFKIAGVITIEICAKWKTRLINKSDLLEDATFSLQYLVKTKRLLTRQNATIIFQPLVYTLCDTLKYLKGTSTTQLSTRHILFIDTLMDTISDFVNTFHLTWKDSIETMCVTSLAYDFVQIPILPTKLVVKGLKLLNTSISKYMSADMVLLLDSEKHTALSNTGTLLYEKCHDSNWEVRDSALEAVCTLSFNANTRFPGFKNILLGAGLPRLATDMALKDGEYFVRATALRCLQEAIQVTEIWEELLKMDNFIENILNIFQNETEGIVRKEAATLVYKIYEVHDFPEDFLPRIYDVMTHAAVGDLHWEVKVSALDFWGKVIETHLTHQGMIDGLFPKVTFSKEHRKIVTLNEMEVKKRLIKVLNQLSHIGCLSVYVNAVQDDCDIEVSRKATKTTKEFVELLKKYKITLENVDLSQPPSPVITLQQNGSLGYASSPSGSSRSSCSSVPSNYVGSPDSGCQFTQMPNPYQSAPLSTSMNTFSEPSNLASPLNQLGMRPPLSSAYQNHYLSTPTTPQSLVPAQTPIDFNQDVPMGVGSPDVNGYDPIRTEMLLDELLNSNDMSLLKGIYNPSDQVYNTSSQMKTKTFLAPSEYLKFAYNRVDTHADHKSQWLSSLEEFDSLLDDILKEYDVQNDVNGMDCY